MISNGYGCGRSSWRVRVACVQYAAIALFLVWVTGCLERPLAKATPETSNVFVSQVTQSSVDKIDLLFMIDNSTSMADKQEILRTAVPALLRRLTEPLCLDELDKKPNGQSAEQGKCVHGEPEFPAIADIHVGVVTSSLGSQGGDFCAPGPGLTPDDHAHLLGTVRPAGSNADRKLTFDAARTWNNTGFLAWDANQTERPPGTNDPSALSGNFQDMIGAAGEQGCGFEASLESWYRFLIDPEPPAHVTVLDVGMLQARTVRGSALSLNADGSTTCVGCDLTLLAQRKAFLRPDSLVAIVMLSDENDCSIRDDGKGWVVGSSQRLPRSSAACASDPNDPCCRSCGQLEAVPPAGCRALSEDSVCKVAPAIWDAQHDSPALRCYDQKRRFGVDLLFPIARYIDALSSPTLTLQSDGRTQVRNPLFDGASGNVAPRTPSLVFLAGIVSVPWQDIADDASLADPNTLRYLTGSELVEKGRWPMLVGDSAAQPAVLPGDPFMIETPLPRTGGRNPVTLDPIVPPDSTDPEASPINGHERNLPKLDDLQYACTFKLTKPRACETDDPACDCSAEALDATALSTENSPLCQPRAGGAATNIQRYAKAYPGVRELQVLRGLKENAIVASICPKLTEVVDSDPNYGYNPAVASIIDRLKLALSGKCLPRKMQTDPVTHAVACQVVEARPSGCDCSKPGRTVMPPELAPAIERELKAGQLCDTPGKPACASFCECQIIQESGADLTACQKGQPSAPGYCYIDDPKSPALAGCPDNQKQLLSFVGSDSNHIPENGAVALVACLGEGVSN